MYRTVGLYTRYTSGILRVLFREGLLYYRCVDTYLFHPSCCSAQHSKITLQRHLYYHVGFDNHDQFNWPVHQKRCLTVRILPSSSSLQLV